MTVFYVIYFNVMCEHFLKITPANQFGPADFSHILHFHVQQVWVPKVQNLWTLRYNNKRLNGSGSVFYTLVFYVIQFYYLICNWSDLLYFLRYYWHTLKCCFSIYIRFTFSVLLLLVSIKKNKILDSSQDSRALYNSNALYDYRRLYGIWQQKMYDSDMSLAMEAYNWMLE